MNNVKSKISDIVEVKLKPNLPRLIDFVGCETYSIVNNKTGINNISFLTKIRVYVDLKSKKNTL